MSTFIRFTCTCGAEISVEDAGDPTPSVCFTNAHAPEGSGPAPVAIDPVCRAFDSIDN